MKGERREGDDKGREKRGTIKMRREEGHDKDEEERRGW